MNVGVRMSTLQQRTGARERLPINGSRRLRMMLTGHLLKDTAYAARYHASAAPHANAIVRGTEIAAYLDRLLLTSA